MYFAVCPVLTPSLGLRPHGSQLVVLSLSCSTLFKTIQGSKGDYSNTLLYQFGTSSFLSHLSPGSLGVSITEFTLEKTADFIVQRKGTEKYSQP